MVHHCSLRYPTHNEPAFKAEYAKYPYELHDFQKWAVEGIVGGHHVLLTAPTGSGKTFGGEFAIDHFCSRGRKVIYTSPIKALSNEKFHAFTQKYPQYSIGLITGDIKANPDAQVLIMTTEILLNKLFQLYTKEPPVNTSVSFDMDVEAELGCVVFDEIHFINDESRGHVWEQCLMMLPRQAQIVGLSATLDNPARFAEWLEQTTCSPQELAADGVSRREVYLVKKQGRAVPLQHWGFLSCTTQLHKRVKDKATQQRIKSNTGILLGLKNGDQEFNETNYRATIKPTLELMRKHDLKVRRQQVLNEVTNLLRDRDMLPALCYVFSRKQLEQCAEELTTNLLEFDSKVPYTVDRECEQILRSKLPNFQEYLQLPEYVRVVSWLRKGVGVHHAGLMPVIREMTELLFARGFIKVLFCTETMSIGINLPVKTTIFTSVHKYTDHVQRMLLSHEYTQAAGRAGRLGKDVVGHVVHLNNLFKPHDVAEYKQMMSGRPPCLLSKFKLSYGLILNLLLVRQTQSYPVNVVGFLKKSLVTAELDDQVRRLRLAVEQANREVERLEEYLPLMRTPVDVVHEYERLTKARHHASNRHRRDMEREMRRLEQEHRYLAGDLQTQEKLNSALDARDDVLAKLAKAEQWMKANVQQVVAFLVSEGFLQEVSAASTMEQDVSGHVGQEATTSTETSSKEVVHTLTDFGKCAIHFKEAHCLVFAKLVCTGRLKQLSVPALATFLCCFTNISVPDDQKALHPESSFPEVNQMLQEVATAFEYLQQHEAKFQFQVGFEYLFQYDLVPYVEAWCQAQSVEECKLVLQRLGDDKGIFLGEFVKALLKAINICNELEKVAELGQQLDLLHTVRQIPGCLLKYVVTNQSLYV